MLSTQILAKRSVQVRCGCRLAKKVTMICRKWTYRIVLSQENKNASMELWFA